jgi:hypothetical protein
MRQSKLVFFAFVSHLSADKLHGDQHAIEIEASPNVFSKW